MVSGGAGWVHEGGGAHLLVGRVGCVWQGGGSRWRGSQRLHLHLHLALSHVAGASPVGGRGYAAVNVVQVCERGQLHLVVLLDCWCTRTRGILLLNGSRSVLLALLRRRVGLLLLLLVPIVGHGTSWGDIDL